MADHRHLFAAPQADLAPDASQIDTEAERIRRAHLGREATIRTVGTLCWIEAGVRAAGLAATLLLLLHGWDEDSPVGLALSVGQGLLVLPLLVYAGLRLRGLHERGRLAYAVIIGLTAASAMLENVLRVSVHPAMAQVGPFLLPVGLFVVLSTGRSNTILTAWYRDEVVAATPSIRPGTSRLTWAILVLLVLVLALLAVTAWGGG